MPGLLVRVLDQLLGFGRLGRGVRLQLVQLFVESTPLFLQLRLRLGRERDGRFDFLVTLPGLVFRRIMPCRRRASRLARAKTLLS